MSGFDDGVDFVVFQQSVGALGRIKDRLTHGIRWLIAMADEPGLNVRHSAVVAHFDDLPETKPSSGYTAVDAIRQPVVSSLHGLDHGGGVHACSRPKRVLAEHGVTRGNGHFAGARGQLYELRELVQIGVEAARRWRHPAVEVRER